MLTSSQNIELFLVVSAFFIPPKQDQAFLQGGTFIFDKDDTIYAHYDESTGAHSDIQEVIDLATKRVNLAKQDTTAAVYD
jgi:hypothetical protein